MPTKLPRTLLRLRYDEAAQAYLRSLPPEHFMEAVPQSQQREITVASLALVHALRPDIQHFNELLVQYPVGREERIGQVVPDNMVVVHDQPIRAHGSYDVPFQPVPPFWILEYVSKYSKRKDYEENLQKYERELKVPYYLTFYPDAQELILHRFKGRKFSTVNPNAAGRYAIAELEMEMAILNEWVRFWFRGELLPLPADLLRSLNETRQQLLQAQGQAQQAMEQFNKERQEKERLQAKLRELGIDPTKL